MDSTHRESQPTAARPIGACWECGYSLRGLESRRCPKCGRPFDPDDPRTMNMDADVSWLARWLMRPPGWMLYVVIVEAMLLSIWAAATPMAPGQFVLLCQRFLRLLDVFAPLSVVNQWDLVEVRYAYATFAWLLVAIGWTARRIARGIVVRAVSRQPAPTFVYWRRWLIAPILLAATILFCMTPLPVHLGFQISRSELNAAVRDHRARPSVTLQRKKGPAWQFYPPLNPRRCGIYWSGFSEGGDQYPRFVGKNPELIVHIHSHGGFVYCPGGTPPKDTQVQYRSMGGDWYSYYRRDGNYPE